MPSRRPTGRSHEMPPFDARSAPPPSDWGELDTALLDDTRAAVPPFPLEVLPSFWRDWILDTARATAAPTDYVGQSLLAAVVGLCGAGAVVRIGPRWNEPLVLWQALVGPPSSGKSPALAPMRELLTMLDAEPAGESARPPCVVSESALSAVAEAVTANRRGVILWRDEPADWLARLCEAARSHWLQAWSARAVVLSRGAPRLDAFAVSVLTCLPPDGLAAMLPGEALASRFLFAWPHPPAHCPLAEAAPAADDEALIALRRIARKAGTPADPLALVFDRRGLLAFDGFLADLQAELARTEGLEMAWLGKGRGTVARLAGVLELLDWSTTGSVSPPGHIGQEQAERAQHLWSGYFRPHARALFHRTDPGYLEGKTRQAARWLKACGLSSVSREDIRREALQRSITASDAEQVLYRLRDASFIEKVEYRMPLRGRPPNRWWVNPALTQAESGGNGGNGGKSTAKLS